MTNEEHLEQLRPYRELDEIVERETGGIWFDQETKTPDYDLRGIIKYCDDKGIKTSDLTDEELKQFIMPAKEHTPAKVN